MTCREMLEMTHSDLDVNVIEADACPMEFMDIGTPDYCKIAYDEESCKACWNRELIDDTPEKVQTASVYGEMKNPESAILDSGDRTQFESGAVRDMHAGKGRFDVMPLEVISDMLGTKEVNHDPIVLDIATFMYEKDTSWLHAALDNFATKAYNGCLYTMLLEVAVHFEEGAKKYGDANWKKGIPAWCYIDSATRHYMKWCRGDTNERHDRAFVWNLMCCIWEVDYGETWRKDQEVAK